MSLEDVHGLWEDTLAGKIPKIFSYYCPIPTNSDPQLAPPNEGPPSDEVRIQVAADAIRPGESPDGVRP